VRVKAVTLPKVLRQGLEVVGDEAARRHLKHVALTAIGRFAEAKRMKVWIRWGCAHAWYDASAGSVASRAGATQRRVRNHRRGAIVSAAAGTNKRRAARRRIGMAQDDEISAGHSRASAHERDDRGQP
jgi:hypothetical protein